jgi:hypothetical protein
MTDTPPSLCQNSTGDHSPISVVSNTDSVVSSVSKQQENPIKRRKQKRKAKKQKLRKIINQSFTSIPCIIPESDYTKRVRKEMRETYPIKMNEIYNKFHTITNDLIMDNQEKKEKILELLKELEDQFYTALFEDLGAYRAKELGYVICRQFEIKHDPKNPFIHL